MRPPKVSERIADSLRSQIVRGEITPGSMLPPEKRMVDELGVSRPTLREAFRILESEGLITVLTGARGGPQVRWPDLSVASRHIGLYLQTRGTTLADLLEARAEFSASCVRVLTGRRTPEGLAELHACVEKQRRIWAAGVDTANDFARWVSLTGDFHELIAHHCGNKTLEAQAKSLGEVLGAHRALSIRRREDPDAIADTSYIPSVIAAYAELLRLIETGDSAAAAEHWRSHLQASADVVYRNRDKDSVISLFE
ncbi:FadR/GntR family transcriptional regulator [Tomitella biformata]|uniref:FadR/GntR family transcriptional regulator n=1 Tax=Tomitella biformata TaxID=630403 RepID=UPI0004B2F8CD|nr:GntR family transcriptional regulator [Tomitella biformata]